MSKKTKKSNNTIKKDEKISSVIEVKEKDNKLIYIFILIIAILLSLLVYFMFFKECKIDCSKCNNPVVEIEVDPKYQLINYFGYNFKMPLDWDFVDDNTDYTISDTDNTIFISFEKIDEDFEIFTSNEYQINYLEKIQTSDNIKIDQSKKIDNYYLFEGKYNDYNYLMIAIGNEKKTVIVKTQFIDKLTYDNKKNYVMKFVLSSIKKSDE